MATCSDCKKLWNQYAAAVQDQLKALRVCRQDALREDGLALMKSEWLERASVGRRQKARKTLSEHQVKHLVQEMEKLPVKARPAKRQ